MKNFMDVNPEFGTINDFKEVLNKAHDLGMYVMLDWVPNHTSWDNPLAAEHPDYYMKDSTGKFTPPIGTDWRCDSARLVEERTSELYDRCDVFLG